MTTVNQVLQNPVDFPDLERGLESVCFLFMRRTLREILSQQLGRLVNGRAQWPWTDVPAFTAAEFFVHGLKDGVDRAITAFRFEKDFGKNSSRLKLFRWNRQL